MRGKCENKEGDLNWAHPFPRVLGFKRDNDIKEGDNTEVRVYLHSEHLLHEGLLLIHLNLCSLQRFWYLVPYA